jgi:hypothetical protein
MYIRHARDISKSRHTMDVPITNTVSTSVRDSNNKENDPRLANTLSHFGRRNRSRIQPIASVRHQLGPRIRQTKQNLNILIYEDETAHEIPQPRPEYYGSNLPALPDVSNGQKYKYALHHVLHRKYDKLMNDTMISGDNMAMDELIAIEMNYDIVSLLERVTGCYLWTVEFDLRDVWLWVQDKRFHRRWDRTQKRHFVKFLGNMLPLVDEARDSEGDPVKMLIDRTNTWIIDRRFEELGLQNLVMEKNGPTVLFTPRGEDRHVIYRRDFTEEEQRLIDILWPEHWAPEQEI